MKKINKKELEVVLGVKTNTLNAIIKRKTLEERLNKIDITLIKTEKIGREIFYFIDTLSMENQLLRIIKKYKLIGREDKLIKYMKEMQKDIETELTRGIKNKSKEIEETEYHTKKYNDILLEEDYMKKDGFVYIKVNRDSHNEKVEREDYIRFIQSISLFNKSKSIIKEQDFEFREKLENYWNLEDFKQLGFVVMKMPKYVPSVFYNTLNKEIKEYFIPIS